MSEKSTKEPVENRNLSEVFEELKKTRSVSCEQINKKKKFLKKRSYMIFKKPKAKEEKKSSISDWSISSTKLVSTWRKFSKTRKPNKKVALISILGSATLFVVIFSTSIFASNKEEKQDKQETVINTDYESNRNAFDLDQIVKNHTAITKTKQKALVDEEVPYPITYQENSSLPKDEQTVIQKGINGKQQIESIRTYENGKLVEETITNTIIKQIPTEEIVQVGTSDFLNQHKIHLGDIIYVLNNTVIREEPKIDATQLCEIKKYTEVKITGIYGKWCKVSFGVFEGYVEGINLTSVNSTPGIDRESRKQTVLATLRFDMELNKSSGLTLADFKRALSGMSQDKNNIISDNAESFYSAEQRYKVNGIFLASLAIHESAWGTSNISNDKKNLFGYGAYDNDAYNSAYTFGEYKEGIDLVAKVLTKNYLNPVGTKIYEEEIAQGKYYNGPTLSGINTRYSTDPNWAQKIFSYMEQIYARL